MNHSYFSMKSQEGTMEKIIILGDAYMDLTLKPKYLPSIGRVAISDDYWLHAAGSGGYAASAFAALGADVRVICNLGTDLHSQFWRAEMTRVGVDISHVRIIEGGRIGVSAVLLHAGDRCFISAYGVNQFPIDKLRLDEIAGFDLLFIAGFMQAPGLWNEEFIQFVKAIKKFGVTTALDPNDDADPKALAATLELLKYIDFFLPNQSELCKISGVSDVAEGTKSLGKRYGLKAIIVKIGAEGAYLYAPQALLQETVPTQKINPVNVNGAGDVFDAAYLLSYLRTEDFRESAVFANQCSAKAISVFGDRFEVLRCFQLGGGVKYEACNATI
jgi:ribokinase